MLLQTSYLGIDAEPFFTILPPTDITDHDNGTFSCGKYNNSYESTTLKLPVDLSCDKCTLQLIWTVGEQNYYECADITLMNDRVALCMGKCKNGGACVNGLCVCEEPYYGEVCENKRNTGLLIFLF